MNILVTGGAGYIGSVTVELLINSGHTVVVLDSLVRGHKRAVHPDATFVKGTVGSAKTVGGLIEKHAIDAILHFAASSLVGESMEDPGKYFANNVRDGIQLIRAAAEYKISKFILSSSAATYGEPREIPISESHPTSPTNPYGESKLILEKMLRWFYECCGLEYVSLRYFNACGASDIYGEDHTPETHLIPLTLMAAKGERDVISIFGDDYPTEDGTCIRDYIHVVDLAHAHILALNTRGSHIYNLGTEHGFSVRQVIDTARKVTGCRIPEKIVPRRQGDPAVLIASSDKIKRELGWKPRYTSLESTIETAWKWKCDHPHGYEDK